jgi:hypothetical protein
MLDHNFVYYYMDSNHQKIQFCIWNIVLSFQSNFSQKNAVYGLDVGITCLRIPSTTICVNCMSIIFRYKRSNKLDFVPYNSSISLSLFIESIDHLFHTLYTFSSTCSMSLWISCIVCRCQSQYLQSNLSHELN